MIEIVQLQPLHLLEIQMQAAQAGELQSGADLLAHGVRLCQRGMAFTVLREGRPVAAGGLVEVQSHYATAWALVGSDAGPAMTAMTRAVRRVIAARAYERVDLTVRADFEAGQRWAWLLGFEKVATLRKWGPDRSDYTLYEKVI